MEKEIFNIGDTVKFRSDNPLYRNLEIRNYYGFICKTTDVWIDEIMTVLLRPTYLNKTFSEALPFKEMATTRLILFEKANKLFVEETIREKQKEVDDAHKLLPRLKMTVHFEDIIYS